jgi:hypothetical protein
MTKPVFKDETGRRRAILMWVGRAVVVLGVALSAAIAFTLTTHIALPGLGGLDSPTLNGSQPESALPIDPGTVYPSGATTVTSDVPDPPTTPRQAKSASPSLASKSTADPTRRTVKSSSTAKTQRATTSPITRAQGTIKPRNSHAATPGSGGRDAGSTGKPTHPDQAKNPKP